MTVWGLRGDAELAWHKPEVRWATVPTVLEAVGEVLVQIDSQAVRYEAALRVRGHGKPFDRFRVRLPAGTRLVSSNASGYSIGRTGPYFGMFGPGSGPFGGGDYNVRLWELTTGREIRRFTGHTKPVWKMAVSPDGSRILSASPDRTIRLWDLSTGKELWQVGGCACDGVAFSPDGHLALGVLIDMKTICLWKLPS